MKVPDFYDLIMFYGVAFYYSSRYDGAVQFGASSQVTSKMNHQGIYAIFNRLFYYIAFTVKTWKATWLCFKHNDRGYFCDFIESIYPCDRWNYIFYGPAFLD